MTEEGLLQAVTQGGIGAVALLLLARVAQRVAERMIDAIDRIGQKLDEHTEKDLKAVAELRQDIAVMSARVDTAIDWQERTPIGGPPSPEQKRATPRGFYSIGKKER
jgi:hypothetical protein